MSGAEPEGRATSGAVCPTCGRALAWAEASGASEAPPPDRRSSDAQEPGRVASSSEQSCGDSSGIRVTEDMAVSGLMEFATHDPDYGSAMETVTRIYRAMEVAKRPAERPISDHVAALIRAAEDAFACQQLTDAELKEFRRSSSAARSSPEAEDRAPDGQST